MITQGDSTSAFGMSFLEVNLENIVGKTVSKIIFVCGSVKIEYENPVFPLTVNLTSEQSEKLRCGKNTAYLIAYDENNQPTTCEGSITFDVSPRKV